jgi:hypothetical protein
VIWPSHNRQRLGTRLRHCCAIHGARDILAKVAVSHQGDVKAAYWPACVRAEGLKQFRGTAETSARPSVLAARLGGGPAERRSCERIEVGSWRSQCSSSRWSRCWRAGRCGDGASAGWSLSRQIRCSCRELVTGALETPGATPVLRSKTATRALDLLPTDEESLPAASHQGYCGFRLILAVHLERREVLAQRPGRPGTSLDQHWW